MYYHDEYFNGDQLAEEQAYHHTSDAEWDAAEALEIGERNPHLCWVCTSRDVLHRNPFYHGPELPHPEEYCAADWED